MTTRSGSRGLALAAMAIVGLLAASAQGLGSPQQQEKKGDGSQSAILPKEKGGRVYAGEDTGPGDTQYARGELIRPLVSAGASGPSAPEEGSFQLRPGDILEIECAIPKNLPSHMTFQVDDEKVLKMSPLGVRRLIPVSMVGGEPKKITGMTRGVAMFQAEVEGETMIHLDLGLRQFQYKVQVTRSKSDR